MRFYVKTCCQRILFLTGKQTNSPPDGDEKPPFLRYIVAYLEMINKYVWRIVSPYPLCQNRPTPLFIVDQ